MPKGVFELCQSVFTSCSDIYDEHLQHTVVHIIFDKMKETYCIYSRAIILSICVFVHLYLMCLYVAQIVVAIYTSIYVRLCVLNSHKLGKCLHCIHMI